MLFRIITSSNVYRSGCIISVQFIVSVRINVFSHFSGHTIIFVQFIVSVRINVFWRFSDHTVLSSFSLLLVFPLTSSNASPVTLYYLRSVYC